MVPGIIIYVYDYPFLSILGVAMMSVIMGSYLYHAKPFDRRSQTVTTFLDEIILFVVFGFVAVFTLVNTMEPDTRVLVGWVIVVLIFMSIGKNLAIALFFT